MTETSIALLGYIGLMVVLLGILATLRTGFTLSGKKAANSFLPTGEDVSPFSARLCRVHANTYESFPIIGGLLLFALATSQTDVTNGLAMIVLGARVLQASVHLLSTSVLMVQVRFFFFLVQYGIVIFWLYRFLMG
ncbi:hypothetical protein MNBD_ALPHA06-554 [hydrothermal vent metagenome]|uniref:MAPEG family protein n=1 Tax=hydrothermal vent metagenome TaxID=652676 RepID=A0A3B0SQ96_9ZZZZ